MNCRGAASAGGRGEGVRGSGVAARGRSGVLVGRLIMIMVPSCDSPASCRERVLGIRIRSW